MSSRIQALISTISHSLIASLSLAVIVEVISNLQINDILLENIFEIEAAKSSIAVKLGIYLSSVFGSFSLFDYANPDTIFLEVTWIVFVCYLLLHVLLAIILYTVSSKHKNSFISYLLKGSSILYLLHSRIFFFIIEYFFMKIVSLYDNCDLSDDESFPCNEAWYGLTIVFCVLNCCLAVVKETIFYEINPNKKNSSAVKNNLYHKMMFLHKLVATTIYFFMQENMTARLINSIINLIFISINLIILFIKLPFYNLFLMKISIITQAASLSLAVVCMLETSGVEHAVLFILCFTFPPLVIKSLLLLYQRLFRSIIEGHIDSPERAIHLIMLLKKHQFGYIPSSIYAFKPHPVVIMSNGILVQQLGNVEKINQSKNQKEHEKKIYSHFAEILMQVLDKHPNSELLVLFIGHIFLNKLENIPKAITLIRRIESFSLSISMRNSIDKFNIKLKKIHNKDFTHNHEDKLNLLSYFKERNLSNLIKEKMINEVHKHLEFWEELRKERVDVQKVINISRHIEKTSSQIEEEWGNHIKGFTRHCLNPIVMYGTYLDLIKEHTDDARKLLKRFWSSANDPHQEQILDVYSDKAAVVIISLEKTNLGAILDASGSTQSLFQMEKEAFMGHSLTSLLPTAVGEAILEFLEQYTRKPTENLDYNLKTYAKTSTGEYFEIGIELKLFPEASRQVKGMIIFEKLSLAKCMLVVNNEGVMIECSENLKQTFYKHSHSEHHAINLQQFVPEFDRINNAFNVVYGIDIESNETITSRAGEYSATRSFNYKHRLFHKHSRENSRTTRISTEPARLDEIKRQGTHFDKVLASDSLSQEDFKKICEEFTQGSRLKIVNDFHTEDGIEYDVQIFAFRVNSKVYKVLSLTNNQEKYVVSQKVFGQTGSSLSESLFAEDFPDANEHSLITRNLLQLYPIGSNISSISRRNTFQPHEKDSEEPPKEQDKLKISDSVAKEQKYDTSNETPAQKIKNEQTRENSISSASSRTMASIKALRSLFERKEYYSLGRRAGLSLFGAMILIVALVTAGFFVSSAASSQVETGVNIVNFANIRLSSALRGWQLATRMFLAYRGLATLNLVNAKNNMYLRAQNMLDQNAFLLQSFSQIDESLVRQLVRDEVELWELNESSAASGIKVNTFLATNILANKLLLIANTTEDLYQDKMLREIQYLINNTCNGYFTFSEEMIVTTQKILEQLITDNNSNLQIILSFELVGIFGICMALLFSVRVVLQSYKRLFKALTKIDEKNVLYRLQQLQKMRLVLSEDLDTKRFSEGTLGVLKPLKKDYNKNKVKDLKKGFQKIEDRILSKTMFIQIARHVTLSLIVLQTVTGLCVASFIETSSSFSSLEDVNRQLSVTTRSGYQTGAIISTFNVEILWANDTTMLVRNQSPRDQLVKLLDAITNVNTDLVSVFTDEGTGISDPFVEQLFESNICIYLPTSAQTSCRTASSFGALGILGINSRLLPLTGTYVSIYLNNPTLDTIKTFISTYTSVMRPSADTLEEAYQFINTYILRLLSEDLRRISDKNLALHLGIGLAVALSTLFVYKVSISRIDTLDVSRGQILKVISFNILVGDKAIGFYLNNHFINMNNAISKML